MGRKVRQETVAQLGELNAGGRQRATANLFFQLVCRRYEKASMILTSNQRFGDWGEIFGDAIIATALLDRLLHHSLTINLKGESHRLNEKKRAGLLAKAVTQEDQNQALKT